ncbi:MAG TPA: DUF4168 domain-containing protein [Candidatus Binataceae bacterium]|nr:DUF4168 domain-containing protein [Candidatus Binataceae bacterium]
MRLQLTAIAACAALLEAGIGFPRITAAVGRTHGRGIVYAQSSGSSAPARVDDAMLERTAAAYVRVRDISIKTEQAMNRTNDSAKKEQLAAESESEKVAAVKAAGMDPQQYNNVLMLVKADTGLQQKFLSYVQKIRSSS